MDFFPAAGVINCIKTNAGINFTHMAGMLKIDGVGHAIKIKIYT